MPTRNEKDRTVIGAHDLIQLYLDFRDLTPKKDTWNASALAGNPPRLIRYQRLVAILAAFGIDSDLASFHSAEWVNTNDPAYQPLLARALVFLSESSLTGDGECEDDFRHQLGPMFETLLDYRVKLEQALTATSGTLCASGLYYIALMKVGSLNAAIRPHVGMVDDLLAELISPTNATFTEDDLAKAHGYPLVDLSEVDLDWI